MQHVELWKMFGLSKINDERFRLKYVIARRRIKLLYGQQYFIINNELVVTFTKSYE